MENSSRIEIRQRKNEIKFDLFFDGENITEDMYTVLCLNGSFETSSSLLAIDPIPQTLYSSNYVGTSFFLRINQQENIQRFMPLCLADLPSTVTEMSFLNVIDWQNGFTLSYDFDFINNRFTMKRRADVYGWKERWSFNDYFEAFHTLMIAGGNLSIENATEAENSIVFDGTEYWGVGKTFNDVIQRSSEELAPYHEAALQLLHATKADSTADAEDDPSFLRLYVPHAKYQSEQIDTFVRLFENYMNRIENRAVTVDVLTSRQGKYFVFRTPASDTQTAPPDFISSVANFDVFMTLCKNDPLEAAKVLTNTGISVEQSTVLIANYAKKYTRLLLDSKQEFEAKCMLLRHAWESDAMEAHMGGQVLDLTALQPRAVGGLLLPSLGSGSILTAQDIISKRLASGDTEAYTTNDQETLRLIQENARDTNEAISLKADFDVVKDETASLTVREGAWRKLKAFGKRNSAYALQLLSNSLVSYLMNKVEGGP